MSNENYPIKIDKDLNLEVKFKNYNFILCRIVNLDKT